MVRGSIKSSHLKPTRRAPDAAILRYSPIPTDYRILTSTDF